MMNGNIFFYLYVFNSSFLPLISIIIFQELVNKENRRWALFGINMKPAHNHNNFTKQDGGGGGQVKFYPYKKERVGISFSHVQGGAHQVSR